MIAGPIDLDDARHYGPWRGRIIERVLVLIGLLSPLRYGATYDDLQRDLAEAGHDVCQRTIKRDMAVLERLGMARQVDGNRWQWCGIGQRAALIAMASQEHAASIGEARAC